MTQVGENVVVGLPESLGVPGGDPPGRWWPAAVLTRPLGPQGADVSASSLWLVVACSAPKGTWDMAGESNPQAPVC